MQHSAQAPEALPACPFCQIVRGEIPAAIVYEDDTSLAFLDRRPLFPGHCLLIPRVHVETLADVLAPLVAPLFQNAQRIERAIEERLGADGIFVAINNRVSDTPHGLKSSGFSPQGEERTRLGAVSYASLRIKP